MHDMWGGTYASFWTVWGEQDKTSETNTDKITFLRMNEKSSWAEGILFGYQHARKQTKCEYFFTHDDDLSFYATSEDETRPIWEILSNVLTKYQPAVLAFPWTQGDQTIPAMTLMREQYDSEEVVPLTGFDSGMVLYHESIVDIYIPFAPRGEGGFLGQWSLCALFLNMFSALLFKGNALRINSLQYKNLINIDNTPEAKRQTPVLLADGTFKHAESRHPYEYRYNTDYQKFLSGGLYNPQQRHGRSLLPQDVTWSVEIGQTPFEKTTILKNLLDFYDVTHPAIAQNAYLQNSFTIEEIDDARSNVDFKVVIYVMADIERKKAFDRLWKSLEAAKTIDRTVEIRVNLAWKGTYKSAYVAEWSKLKSKHGDVVFHTNLRNREPRNFVMESWRPIDRNEYAMILTDDVAVSKYFLSYASTMIQKVYHGPIQSAHVFGISLHSMVYNEVDGQPFEINNEHKAIGLQMPDLWGGIYSAPQWSIFVDWYMTHAEEDVFIPYSLTNRWPMKRSWRKYLLRYLHDKGKYLIFPNSEGQGGHVIVVEKSPLDLDYSHSLQAPPLVQQETGPEIIESNLQIYNSSHLLSSVDALPHEPNKFDKCTMIITVYSRYATIVDRLKHYHTLSCLEAIVVIWNNPKVSPPMIPAQFRIPVYIIKQAVNSMNNRFKAYDQIKTACVVNMDDDWDMDHNHLRYVIQSWQKQFFRTLVGFKHEGRMHVHKDGSWKYSTDNRKAVSMLLPSGFVYDSKFLDVYSNQIPQSTRDIVDRDMNCDDILFNYMISNYTRIGPVVIDYNAKVMDIGFKGGLWTDGDHFKERDACMQSFADIFGYMPLKFTKYWFTKESELKKSKGEWDVPRFQDMTWYDEL